jgi:hypothetical protein
MSVVFPLRPEERTPFLAAAVILAAASVALLCLPLFNYLGYEFSASVALLLPLVTGVVTLRAFVRRWPRGTSVTARDVTDSVRDLLVQNAALLAIPFAAALAAAVVVKNCAIGEGMIYYILLPAVTSVWLTALAAFCAAVFRRPALWYAGVLLLALLHPLLLGYYTPAAFSYNVLYGYFPGLTYDESLHLSWRLVLFRYLTVCSAALFLLSAEFVASYRKIGEGIRGLRAVLKNFRFHREGRYLLAAVALQIALGWLFRVQLGFESTSSSIARELGASYATRHFEILYDSSSFSPEEIRRVAAMHEFRYDEVRAALHVSGEQHIRSFLYPGAATKRRLTGAGNTDIAKPWSGEIHLNAEAWEGNLKHEIVHVVAGEFGMPVIRAHYNTGLVEGLATAVDDDFGGKTLAEYAAAMFRFGLIDRPGDLLHLTGFALRSSAVSYVAMGSFCKFLIAEYGIDKLKDVYGGASPERVYGKPYEDLLAAWQESLGAVPVPDDWRPHVDYYFRRPSIFAKVCARAVANRNEEGARLLGAKDPLAAYAEFESGLAVSWNSGSYAGMIRSAYAAARFDSVRRLMRAVEPDSAASAYAGLLVPYGDALWASGDTAGARAAYRRAVAYDLSPASTEAALARGELLADTLLAARLPGILFSSRSDSAVVDSLAELRRASDEPLLAWLLARGLYRLGRYAEVPQVLGSIAVPLHPALEAGKNRLMGEAYFRLGDWDHASAHFRIIADDAPSAAARREADDDVRRCAWFSLHEELLRP